MVVSDTPLGKRDHFFGGFVVEAAGPLRHGVTVVWLFWWQAGWAQLTISSKAPRLFPRLVLACGRYVGGTLLTCVYIRLVDVLRARSGSFGRRDFLFFYHGSIYVCLYVSPNAFRFFQVLDYTIQMHRLLPLVAAAFGFHFTGQSLMRRLRRLEREHVHGELFARVRTTIYICC